MNARISTARRREANAGEMRELQIAEAIVGFSRASRTPSYYQYRYDIRQLTVIPTDFLRHFRSSNSMSLSIDDFPLPVVRVSR